MADQMDITLRRNEDWARGFNLEADGEPIDLTGCTIEMLVREQLTDVVLATANVSITDAAQGMFNVFLPGTGALIEWGSPLRRYEFPYDLRITEPGGRRTDLVEGKVIVERGIT